MFLGFIVGVIFGLGLDVLIRHEIAMRRQLKAAQNALEAREAAPEPRQPTIAEVQATIDKRIAELSGNPEPPKPIPDFTGGIGPTAIRNREAFEAQQQEKAEPRFASPRTLNPGLTDIREAAREATNGRPN